MSEPEPKYSKGQKVQWSFTGWSGVPFEIIKEPVICRLWGRDVVRYELEGGFSANEEELELA